MKRNLHKYSVTFIALAMIIYLVMDYLSFYIHEGVSVRMFDFRMFSGYDFTYATTFLNEISEKGRNIYLFIQLPLDFIFPVLIALFFSIYFYEQTKRKEVVFLGFAPMIFDYTENIFVIIMLTTTSLTPTIVNIASIVTIIKGVLYAINILIFIILVIRSRRKKAISQEEQVEID